MSVGGGPDFDLASVQLQCPVDLTGRELGRGSYGVVLEAEIPGAVCAVKRVHDVFARQDRDWQSPEQIQGKFLRECKVISRLRHPHIVQFLGVCEIVVHSTPTLGLATEKLFIDLHSMLDQSPTIIPLGLKFSILHDVASGLHFLHAQTPPIIHRDLTASNVLLNSAMVAKIADLGMARLIPDGENQLTSRPGNPSYMPPESDGKEYNKSLDMFSFGVLALFTLIQKSPEPLPVKSTEEGTPVFRSEVQRRAPFLKELHEVVKGHESLIKAVEQCLDDTAAKRPEVVAMQALLQSAKTETSTEHLEMSKLDLVRAIEKEREDNKQEQCNIRRECDEAKMERENIREELKRMQEEHKRELEDLKREQGDRHKRELEDLKREQGDRHKRELEDLKRKQVEKLKREQKQHQVQMEKKELAIQLLVKEKEELQLITKDHEIEMDEECNRVLCEKNKLENELQKKEEAAQQREKEVRGSLASEGNEAGGQGRGRGERGREGRG